MITEQEAREAAKNSSATDLAGVSREVIDLLVWAVTELHRREAERAERAKPIDDEWLESIGGRLALSREEPGFWFDDVVRYNTAFRECVVCNARPSITTRGQLLDLLNALRGGA